jgi:gamma-glutamyltranspeptidase / glutathione hydrolase
MAAPVLARRHMAVSSHPEVSAAGLAVLTSGGNAIDATLAMAAMSWLALPGQCGVGGDAFAVVRDPDGTVWTVAGSGFGPDGGDLAFYHGHGLATLPLNGPLAVSVPGAMAALEALHARGATRELTELWAPAAAAAERGLPCTAKTRADIARHADELRRDEGAARMFLPGGAVPRTGDPLPCPELARSVRQLASEPASFYKGHFAERAVASLATSGAPFTGAEWSAGAHALAGPAITGGYRGLTVHQIPPPSPGWMVLQQAAMLDGLLGRLPWLGARAVGLMADAARRAFRDRLDRCGSDTDAWRSLLSAEEVAAARAGLLSEDPGGPVPGLRPDGDTTSTLAVDADGRAVSFIHSLAFTFGARITIPGTGIMLNNRLGRGAYLADGHPNAIMPRRRPLHTLNAWLATDAAGRLVHAGNTPGGDGQVQWNMQLLSHLADHGLDPWQAVAAPRFTVAPGSDAGVLGTPDELACETRLGTDVLAGLRAAGYPVREVGPWEAGGSALVISADHERGVLSGAADPRQDGVALGG